MPATIPERRCDTLNFNGMFWCLNQNLVFFLSEPSSSSRVTMIAVSRPRIRSDIMLNSSIDAGPQKRNRKDTFMPQIPTCLIEQSIIRYNIDISSAKAAFLMLCLVAIPMRTAVRVHVPAVDAYFSSTLKRLRVQEV